MAGSGAGVLGPCPVFSINSAADPLTLPDGNDGNQYYDRDCPVGAALAVGRTLTWHSNSEWQGSGPADAVVSFQWTAGGSVAAGRSASCEDFDAS